MAEAIPDALVDEIAVAGTPDEARERLAQWRDLCDEPLLYAPTVGVPPERVAREPGADPGASGARPTGCRARCTPGGLPPAARGRAARVHLSG